MHKTRFNCACALVGSAKSNKAFEFQRRLDFKKYSFFGTRCISNLAEFPARSGISLCLVISRVELIRKDKEKKFRSARKIPPGGKWP
jgi:hypothetical protein